MSKQNRGTSAFPPTLCNPLMAGSVDSGVVSFPVIRHRIISPEPLPLPSERYSRRRSAHHRSTPSAAVIGTPSTRKEIRSWSLILTAFISLRMESQTSSFWSTAKHTPKTGTSPAPSSRSLRKNIPFFPSASNITPIFSARGLHLSGPLANEPTSGHT